MRDVVGSSVGPTASVSMLKPRRANRPATRASTPGLFSTRIDRTCLRPVRSPETASSSSRFRTSAVPGSPIALAHHVPRGLAGGNHRIALFLTRHVNVHEHGAIGLERRLERVLDLVLVRHAHARGPE